MPTPPPGFVLDNPQPPPGFVLDQPINETLHGTLEQQGMPQFSTGDNLPPKAPTKGERFGQGFGDPYAASAQISSHATPSAAFDVMRWLDEKIRNNVPGFENAPAYKGNLQDTPAVDQLIKQREADYQKARGPNAGFDWYRLGGNIAATAPMALAAPGTLPGALAVGGATGALQPVTDQGDFWRQKGLQTGLGVGGGAVGYGVGKLASRLLAPKVTADIQTLMDRGVTPTPGQIMGGKAAVLEEKAASVPVLGGVIKGGQKRAMDQFNTAVYQDVLAPINGKVPTSVGREAVAQVGDQLSQAYDDILPKLNFKPDQQFANDIGNIASMAKSLPKTEARQFVNFMKDKLAKALGPTGQMDGRTFQTLDSYLSSKIANLAKAPSSYEKDLGRALGAVQETLRDTLTRSNAGNMVTVGGKTMDGAQRLAAIRAGWAQLVRLENAAAATGQKEAGVFTPAQFSRAVKAADQSVRKRAFARGDALMQELADAGKNVLGSKYPDSGTAGRLMTGGLATALLTGGAFSPAALAAGGGIGLGMLPYTAAGQRLAAYLLAGSRPAAVKAAGSVAERAAPFMGTGLAALLAGRQ